MAILSGSLDATHRGAVYGNGVGVLRFLMKIFNLSLHRSGTQSVTKFFRDHGLEAAHWPGYDFARACVPYIRTLDTEAIWEKAQPWLEENEVFSDVPYGLLYREALRTYPDAKFFIVLRDPNAWLRSIRRHVGKRELFTLEKIQYWLFMQERKDRLADYSDNELLRCYREHSIIVINALAAARADFRLFALDAPSIAEDMAKFVGFPVRHPFPHRDWQRPKPG
jgi:hypothetical protein